MKKLWAPLVVFIAALGLLEILAFAGLLNRSLLPAPSDLFKVLKEMPEDIWIASAETLLNSFLGFLSSIIFGLIIAFAFSISRPLREAILPFAIFFQTVPIIAISPLLVIYLGFGAPTVIASAFIVSIFPIIANTLVGLESYQKDQLDLFKVYKATSFQILFKLKVPSAYRHIYAGFKISAGLSIVGVIAGEFVAGGGLGALIDSARTQQRVDIVFVALLALALIGLLYLGILALINFTISKRRPL